MLTFSGEELDKWIKEQNWTIKEDGKVFICNQEAHIKSKNIAEKIDFDSELHKTVVIKLTYSPTLLSDNLAVDNSVLVPVTQLLFFLFRSKNFTGFLDPRALPSSVFQ